MAARAGIEPASALVETVGGEATSRIAEKGRALLDAQGLVELGSLVAAWPKLPREIRFSILALVRAAEGESK